MIIKDEKKHNLRKWILYILLIIIGLLFSLIQLKEKKTYPAGNFEKNTFYASNLFLRIFAYAGQDLRDFFYAVFHFKSMYRNIRQLEKEKEVLQLKNISLNGLENENKKLKRMLQLKASNNGKIIPARVIYRDGDNWLNYVIIDKGSKDNVRILKPVITNSGLIGRVIYVDGRFSKVMLLTDSEFTAACRVYKKNISGIVYGNGEDKLIMKYIDSGSDIQINDMIITSGISKVFPDGLKVGKVVKVIGEGKDMFKKAVVEPYSSVNYIDYVWYFI